VLFLGFLVYLNQLLRILLFCLFDSVQECDFDLVIGQFNGNTGCMNYKFGIRIWIIFANCFSFRFWVLFEFMFGLVLIAHVGFDLVLFALMLLKIML
jgi:hypothetical protein